MSNQEVLNLYNSLTNKLEPIIHDKSKPIKWYTCGPTIYDSAHMGHARTFITFDIIRRVLCYLGYNIIYVMNITDIDDKIINKVRTIIGDNNEMNHEVYKDFISKMEQEFFQDMDSLNILRPTVITRVTEYIDKMLKYTEKIQENGFAYESCNSVYLNSEKFKKQYKWDFFNKNLNSDFSECDFNKEKKNAEDFALWKASKPGEIFFDSKWGKGRPGWHLECSVMSHDILGDNIDIHSGGIDLIFPHHNNEIIQ